MPKVQVYNVKGEQTGEISLDENVFGVEVKPELIQFVANAQRANTHQPYAHAKNRAEVRGGGRKPWRQKGTGRARHGSIRSPLWRGGGATFGPRKERNMSQKVNIKTRRKAIRMMLSDKVGSGHLVVVDSLQELEGKTKQLAALLAKLPIQNSSALLAVGERNEQLTRAAKNIKRVNTILADSANVGDLLKYSYLVCDTAGVKKMTNIFK